MAHLSKPHARLELTPDELRNLGYAVVDQMVEHYVQLSDLPVTTTRHRADLEALLREPMPREPTAPGKVLQQTVEDVFGNVMFTEHPRFFAFVPGPSNSVSAVADMLVAGYNAFAGTWLEASGAGMVEVLVIDWLREMIGMPEGTGGVLTSGGSLANLQAIHTARHAALGDDDTQGVMYYSDQTHSSVDRATRILGLRPDQVRRLPSDDAYRVDVDALRAAIREDKAVGRVPFCVVANAGTTNTAAVDPLAELADLCAAEGVWLHVDGAYGAAAALTAEGRALLKGIERADSVTVDPHKWLFQPYEMGCLLVRDRRALRNAFLLVPEYLADTAGDEDDVNFYDYGVQLTRGFRALKLWMSLKVFGADAFAEAVDWGFQQGEIVAGLLREDTHWEIVSGPQMGVINFRYAPGGDHTPAAIDALQQDIVNDIVASGYAMVATTVLKGRKVVRLILINPRTTEDELVETVERLTAMAAARAGVMA
ncbi:MAG: aminotransferase class I/II-fold pyridoxal phosphate-dependent enzyme [Chloroflexota bacterium]